MSSTDTVKALYAAFEQGDMPAVMATFDPQIVWNEAEGNPYHSGDGWVGGQAILENLFARIGDDWEFFNVKPKHFHDAGDHVTVEARYHAKSKSTGKEMDCQVCHIFTVQNGKITRMQQYADTAKLREVMGVA